jgi:hypothetical protein
VIQVKEAPREIPQCEYDIVAVQGCRIRAFDTSPVGSHT